MSTPILFIIGLDLFCGLCSTDTAPQLMSASELAAQTFFVFYFGSNDSQRYPISDFDRIFEHPEFDGDDLTELYTHGYSESQNSLTVRTVVASYRTRGNYNILALDWAKPAYGNYTISIYNAVVIGEILAGVFNNTFSNESSKLQISKFHCIGLSLGGQLLGVAARKLIEYSKGCLILDRVTGLDPSNGGFRPGLSKHLSYKDAKMVDIIHTDMGVRGAPNIGSVNFYPNGGVSNQPGCKYVALNENNICSHERSAYYYAESIASAPFSTFFAAAAKDWFNSEPEKIVNMGIDCPSTARGNYYLQTNSSSPYTLGRNGIYYDASIWNIKDPNSC